MKVHQNYALIADIHGNIDAFEAVLADAKNQNIDKYIFLGDYYGEDSHTNDVIDKIKSIHDTYIVKGNREETLATITNDTLKKWSILDQMATFVWCYNDFTDENRQYIKAMPSTLKISGNIDIYLAHSPTKYCGEELTWITGSRFCTEVMSRENAIRETYDKYINDNFKKNNEITRRISNLPKGIYIFGHTHTQWHKWAGGNLLINPGAVGNNKDLVHGAHYSILSINGDNVDVQDRIIPYNVENTVEKLRKSDMYKAAPVWSKLVINMLLSNREVFNYFFALANEVNNEYGEVGFPCSNKVFNESAKRWFEIH